MKKCMTFLACFFCFISLVSCSDQPKSHHTLVFATSADYPPFEYKKNGKFVGFDIQLGRLIAQQLGKQAVFKDMQFSSILAAIENNMVDAGIATLTVTKEREKNFDFSIPYYTEELAMLYPKSSPLKTQSQLKGQTIACQLGTTMEVWLKGHAKQSTITTMDTNPQAVEALKAGHVNGVLVDKFQAIAFSEKNPTLAYSVISKANSGYAVAFKKGSPLREKVNQAIMTLEKNGTIKKLEAQYLGSHA